MKRLAELQDAFATLVTDGEVEQVYRKEPGEAIVGSRRELRIEAGLQDRHEREGGEQDRREPQPDLHRSTSFSNRSWARS